MNTFMKMFEDEIKGMDETAVKKWAEKFWENNRPIRDEFSDYDCFLSYASATAKGLVKKFPGWLVRKAN